MGVDESACVSVGAAAPAVRRLLRRVREGVAVDWQKTYREFAAQSAAYLSEVLRDKIDPMNYESDHDPAEWTLDDEIADAWRALQKYMAHLDAGNRERREIPV
mgnify:CR=1 FL=1